MAWLRPADNESNTVIEKFESIGNKAIKAGIQDFRAANITNWFEPGENKRVYKIKVTLNKLAIQERQGLYYQLIIPFFKRDY